MRGSVYDISCRSQLTLFKRLTEAVPDNFSVMMARLDSIFVLSLGYFVNWLPLFVCYNNIIPILNLSIFFCFLFLYKNRVECGANLFYAGAYKTERIGKCLRNY